MRSFYIVLSWLFFLLLFQSCVADAPISENYFDGVGLIKGGAPPSAPVLSYNEADTTLSWGASIDPETNAEVGDYYLYSAPNKKPEDFYDANYHIETISGAHSIKLNTQWLASGIYYFWITGFDGGRESPPSNVIYLIK